MRLENFRLIGVARLEVIKRYLAQ